MRFFIQGYEFITKMLDQEIDYIIFNRRRFNFLNNIYEVLEEVMLVGNQQYSEEGQEEVKVLIDFLVFIMKIYSNTFM
uniref:Uncharacterized protein n=1 Tax=Caenorhabditis tropicalis TaxID=1561998 RepID=A0A1I7UF01_9PELO